MAVCKTVPRNPLWQGQKKEGTLVGTAIGLLQPAKRPYRQVVQGDGKGGSYRYSAFGGVTYRTTTPSVHLGPSARGARGCIGARHAGTCSRQLRAGAPLGRLLPAGPRDGVGEVERHAGIHPCYR